MCPQYSSKTPTTSINSLTSAPVASEVSGSLGSNTSYLTPRVSRDKRYRLQNVASGILDGERVSYCMRHMGYGRDAVQVKHDGQKAFYSGVAVCGSVWHCPVCASRITESRRSDLSKSVESWDGAIVMATFTLQHSKEDDLHGLVDALNDSITRVKRGASWKRFIEKYSVSHNVTSLEVTHGLSGWHPHKHMLLFLDRSISAHDLRQIKLFLSARFMTMLAKNGAYASPQHGLNVVAGNALAGDYVSKWGVDFEMTKGNTKKSKNGLSPFAMLDRIDQGFTDLDYVGLFIEYAEVFKGRRQLVWSRGSRDAFGLDVELSESELALVEPDEAEVFIELGPLCFDRVVAAGLRLKLLQICDDLDFAAVVDLFILHDIPVSGLFPERDSDARVKVVSFWENDYLDLKSNPPTPLPAESKKSVCAYTQESFDLDRVGQGGMS